MIVNKAVDYMQFTIDRPFSSKNGEYELKESFISNYQVMRVLPSGVTCHHGHNLSDKWLCIFQGEQCERIKDHRAFVKNAINNGAKFSRIDYAVTVQDGMTMARFRKLIKDGKVSGVLYEASDPKSIVNDKTQKSETTNLGNIKKRGKFGMFRAYDKAVDLGLDDLLLTRFELEERKDRAQVTAKRFGLAGMDIGDLIQQRVKVDDELWRNIMGAVSDKLPRFKDDEEIDPDSTWRWLLEAVAPSLGRNIARDFSKLQNTANFEEFNALVTYHYEKELATIRSSQRVVTDDNEAYVLDFD